jgi:hypothetical protein
MHGWLFEEIDLTASGTPWPNRTCAASALAKVSGMVSPIVEEFRADLIAP